MSSTSLCNSHMLLVLCLCSHLMPPGGGGLLLPSMFNSWKRTFDDIETPRCRSAGVSRRLGAWQLEHTLMLTYLYILIPFAHILLVCFQY